MIGAPFGIGYSCTIANDGELTSSGSAPSSAAMARTRNVLPDPRSPMRWTVASAGSCRAISRPNASVSASVRAISATEATDRGRDAIRYFRRQQPRVADLPFEDVARQSVDVDGGACGIQ